MPAAGHRRGGMVYHWKHGWIPLDHFAALSKAHHSKTGAAKVMQKHGIDVPKGYKSDHKPSAPSKPAASPAGKDFRSMSSAEKIRAAEIMHGTGSKQHQAAQAKFGGASAHPAPHTLKPGDHATVHGVDEHGAPIHFTGEVRGTTSVTMSKGSKKTPMLGITVKRESPTTGAMRHDTVYVPDPNRDPARIDAARKAGAERDQLRRDLNAKYAGKGSSYMQQRHGVDPAAMSTTDLAKYHKSLQAEHDMVLLSDGKKLRDAMAAEHAKRAASPSAGSAHAARAAELRAAAAKKRAEADRIANGAGVNDRAAAMLSGKTHQRQLAKDDSALRRFSEKQREAKALESKAHLAEGRAKTATEKQDAANLGVTAAQMSRGDMIQHKGSVHMVTKVNRTTVSVPSIVGGSWEDKLSIGQVSKHVKVADMKESTLRTLMSRAKGNAGLQAVYMAELKRRGLSL